MGQILITGGAGFIGSHLADSILQQNKHEVIVFDNLEEQVHGKSGVPPSYLNQKINFIKGTVVDYAQLKENILNCDTIIHLGASVGVSQSMYKIKKYTETNILGTSNLLDILVNSNHSVKKLIIASSNTVYGEGKYYCENCGYVYPKLRSVQQLKDKWWEISCTICNSTAKPVPTDEESPFNSSSIYALSKQVQEQSAMLIGKTYGINTTALRFFLVYGSRQSLSNPYTGVCGIFTSRLLSHQPALVYEDGLQTRDFIHVKDICQAIHLTIEKTSSNGEIFNVGTGNSITIKEIAKIITEKINSKIKPIVNQKYRVGDIRHCIADITKIKKKLGFTPNVSFKDGIDDLLKWIKLQKDNIQDKSQIALNELKEKGLLR